MIKRNLNYCLIMLLFFSTGSYAFNKSPSYFSKEEEAKKDSASAGCDVRLHKSEKGWWWNCLEQEEDIAQPNYSQGKKSEKAKESTDPCLKKESYDPEKCGFVNPDQISDLFERMEFQKQQYLKLGTVFAMEPSNQKFAMEFQKQRLWIINKAIEGSRTWEYALIQNPDLNPSIIRPFSSFGLDMVTNSREIDKKSVWEYLKKEGAILFYFTRSDCEFCHKQEPIINMVEKEVNIPIYNLSLDDKCLDSFLPVKDEKTGKLTNVDRCFTSENPYVTRIAKERQVKIVPDLIMYLPDNSSDKENAGVFIRIATGIVPKNTITSRVYHFFNGVQRAFLNGLTSQDGNAPVSFEKQKEYGLGKGLHDVQK